MASNADGGAADDHSSPAAAADPSAALQREIAELRVAVQARDEFISMIVHEVRNPLTPLLMQTSSLLLLTDNPNAPIAKIAKGVRSLNLIVEQLLRRTSVLLDISRMSSGIYRLEPSLVDAGEILRSVVSRMSLEAQVAGSILEAQVEDGITGNWDALAFEQIADNLVSNAIKYGEGRPVRIELSARDGMATLKVSDRGMGISPENLDRVFDRFERAVRRGQASGFGIGLWLVGRLTQEMGGSIGIQSAVGEGTTISVTLPTNGTDTGT